MYYCTIRHRAEQEYFHAQSCSAQGQHFKHKAVYCFVDLGSITLTSFFPQTTKWVGASTLMSVLTSYCHKDSKDVEKSIKVGVVGLPNVGRKSLINSLKKARGIETTTGKTLLRKLSHTLLCHSSDLRYLKMNVIFLL